MLLFDMDGTLIDSNGIWKDVDTEFLARRGLPYTQAYYEGVAHTIFPLAAKFTKEFCHLPESEEEIMAEWMELVSDLYAGSVPEKPGVRAFLERMRARGERMAVVTSAVPVHCRSALTHLGLLPYFERIFFAQELGMEKKDAGAVGKGGGGAERRAGGVHAVRRFRGGHPGRQGRGDAHGGRGRSVFRLLRRRDGADLRKNSSAGSTRRKWRRFKAVRVDFWQRCHYNCVVAFVRRLSCAAAAGRSR